MEVKINSIFSVEEEIKFLTMGVVIPVSVTHLQINTDGKETRVYYHLKSVQKYNFQNREQHFTYGPVEEEDLVSMQKLQYGKQKD